MTMLKFKPAVAKDFFRDTVVPAHVMSLIDTVFNDSVARFERNVFFTPRVDVLEKQNSYEIHLALPGMKKEEIQIEVEAEKITISGERKLSETNTGEKFHLVENYYGKFSRTFTLPENIDKSAIEASFEHGVLTIVLNKTEAKQVKNTISIK